MAFLALILIGLRNCEDDPTLVRSTIVETENGPYLYIQAELLIFQHSLP
jgi:hypothetical protein